ncbi:MAG: ATP-dependent Clp protease proteolytic subunit [Alphaproteobacteria bacterium]|nr:ATP-dependent Clp protease proteolytic subunit [Alphaproteobacteria bacterium]
MRTKTAAITLSCAMLFSAAASAQDNRVVRLVGEINNASANRVIAELESLSAKDKDAPITVWLNSSGGYLYEGFRIREKITAIPNKVDIVCGGQASSMAAVLFITHQKTKGERIVFQACDIMTHAPYRKEGNKLVTFTSARDLAESRHRFAMMLHAAANIPYGAALAYFGLNDRKIGLEEAQRWGLIDRLIPAP